MLDHGYDDYPGLENSLFIAVIFVKSANLHKHKYFGYGIGLGRCGTFSVALIKM